MIRRSSTPRFVAGALALALMVTSCASGRAPAFNAHTAPTSPLTTTLTSTPTRDVAAQTKQVSFRGVQLRIPANWPVIDGAHAIYTCSSTFLGQADRAYLGVSYQGLPSCPGSPPNTTAPPADGVWLQPSGPTPPAEPATTLPGGQVLYSSGIVAQSAVTVWFQRVSITIGVGATPALERAIANSITYRPSTPDTPMLGRCPSPDSTPPAIPTPSRVTAPLSLNDHNGQLKPEPATDQPKVDAHAVWTSLFHDFGGFSGALRWSIAFGSYSAQTPATINPDGSQTPSYQGVPTWLIRGQGVQTDYGPCGITVLAPYNANTGQSMGLTTQG